MILVLLSKFCGSGESIPGYMLCQTLVEEGHALYVTTTTPEGSELEKEIHSATNISRQSKGSIRILHPECEEFDEPKTEWIAKLYKTYFGYLSELRDVHTIIGTLPGTAKTAVDLRKALNCKVVLLTSVKIGADQEELKTEFNKLAELADEVWSVGPGLFAHFHDIFQEAGSTISGKHKELLLKPDRDPCYRKGSVSPHDNPTLIRKVVSAWNHGHSFFYKGRKTVSRGSNLQNFFAVGGALANINKHQLQRHELKIQWHVHGLKNHENLSTSIKSEANGDILGLVPLNSPNCLDDVKLKNCLAFIVPDVDESTFNFVALSAIWQGVPTIVPSESSVGKFLLNLTCPVKTRAVVTLTGDIKADRETWIKKLHKEILNYDAKPIQWARELSEYLQNNPQLWQLDLNVLKSTQSTIHPGQEHDLNTLKSTSGHETSVIYSKEDKFHSSSAIPKVGINIALKMTVRKRVRCSPTGI